MTIYYLLRKTSIRITKLKFMKTVICRYLSSVACHRTRLESKFTTKDNWFFQIHRGRSEEVLIVKSK